MSELVIDPPVQEQPPVAPAADPFGAARPRGEAAPAPEAPTPPPPAAPTPEAPVQAPPAAPAPAPAVASAEAVPLFKELGYESKEALAEAVALAKQAETFKANQRDPHDLAIREMLADPQKASAYFALQSVQPENLAAGSPEQQRQLLFESYKVANPELSGRLAELGFNKEYQAKYGLMDSDDPDEAEDAEFAKLQYQSALAKAVPAIKTAQEAAKVAVLPASAPADGLAPEQRAANDQQWLNQVDAVLAKPTVEQTFQVEGQPVTAAYDTKHPDYKAFMDDPLPYLEKELRAIAYPNGAKEADMAALAQVFGRIKQPDVIAKSAWTAAIASVGAHVPLTTLTNPAPDAPQGPSGGAGTIEDAFAKARPRT